MLENLKPKQRIYPCRVRSLLTELPEDDAKIFSNALNDSTLWAAWGLHQALKKRGITVTDKAIKRHRDNDCSCRHLS